MANLIYIMGKSSSGKDTIYQRLKNEIETNFYVPYTTRPKRDGEQDGREYHFLDRKQFEQLEAQDKVMEQRTYNVINIHGQKDIWTYATIADNQWEKEGDFLAIGTLESYTSIKKYLEEHPERNLKMLPVYISIDEQEREKRARKRELTQAKPNYEEMERRLKKDNIDFSKQKLDEAGITENETFENYDLDKCVSQITSYIKENTKTSFKEKYKIQNYQIPISTEGKSNTENTKEREEM